ncbi:hypothetical protein G6F43_009231 [Rhizopus delemar]|nr:hypothetical protein G6F43_009231 [Rhizopus delemar]
MQSLSPFDKNNPGKLMSISSIIAGPSNSFQEHKVTSHPYHHPHHFPLFRSPPASPEPSSPSSSLSSSPPAYSLYQKKYSEEDDEREGNAPLTLEERRLRNKAASAKYRQKKNQQQNEMKQMISKLSEQHAVLERQLQELRSENERLKVTSDKLRGKMVARKMLRKWIGRQTVSDSLQSQSQPSLGDYCHHHSFDTNPSLLDLSNDEEDDVEV